MASSAAKGRCSVFIADTHVSLCRALAPSIEIPSLTGGRIDRGKWSRTREVGTGTESSHARPAAIDETFVVAIKHLLCMEK